MKIALPKFDENIGSQRIPFLIYKELLESNYSIEFISYKSIKEADIVFVHSDLSSLNNLRKLNPLAKYILFKPHCELPLTCSGGNFFARLFSFIIHFIKNNFFTKFRNYKANINSADLLVCDTPRISRFFRSKGYKTIYCSLIDIFNLEIIERRNNRKKQPGDLQILYTGNLSHFNANIKNFVDTLSISKAIKERKIIINCLCGKENFKLQFKYSKNINVNFIKYDSKNLKSLLTSSDLGWVPNRYPLSDGFKNPLFKVLFTTTTQYFDLIFSEKFSANAGRCILFAQYGIPFITNPNEETTSLFHQLSDDLFYETKDELRLLLDNYSSFEYRKNVSEELKEKFNFLSFSKEQSNKLYDAIKSCRIKI